VGPTAKTSLIIAAAALSLVGVSCGGDTTSAAGVSTANAPSTTTPTTTTVAPSTTAPTTTTVAPSTTAPTTTTVAPTTTSALPRLPAADSLTAILDDWRLAHNVPGVVVAVRVGTEPPLVIADGTDAKTGAPLVADVPFAIASITKTFIGAVALQLIDEGRLALDDSLSQYLPDFPNGERITVRQLLTHTSGLAPEGSDGVGPSAYDEAFRQLVLANLDKTFTADEILAYVRDRPLDFEPGTGVQYSNVNTILLGRIIEIVTGTPLTSVLHQRLLDPLGLAHTYFEAVEDGPRPTPGLFTLTDGGAILNTADFPTRGVLSSIGAAGAMVSNVDDLVLWSEHFLRAGAFGHTDLHDSRFAVDPSGLGLGVIVWAPGVGGCVFQRGCPDGTSLLGVMGAGSIPGTNSAVVYFPRWDLTVIALANSSLVDLQGDLVSRILEQVVG
jgi:D-alanyl-D-alanine carboxypeptidase